MKAKLIALTAMIAWEICGCSATAIPGNLLTKATATEKQLTEAETTEEESELTETETESATEFVTEYQETAAPETTTEDVGSDEHYIFPESSERLLDESDISNVSRETLRFGRNEIYARHGRSFHSIDLQTYFYTQAWYHASIGPDDFDESVLNETEKANINFLKAAEEACSDEPASDRNGIYTYQYTAYSTGENIDEHCTATIEISDATNSTLTAAFKSLTDCEWGNIQDASLTFSKNKYGVFDCNHIFEDPISISFFNDMLYFYEEGSDCIGVYSK